MSAGICNASEVLAQLMWGPKTANELAEAVGMERASIYRITDAFRRSGVVYIHSYRRRADGRGWGPSVFAIQSTPFANEDAKRQGQ